MIYQSFANHVLRFFEWGLESEHPHYYKRGHIFGLAETGECFTEVLDQIQDLNNLLAISGCQ